MKYRNGAPSTIAQPHFVVVVVVGSGGGGGGGSVFTIIIIITIIIFVILIFLHSPSVWNTKIQNTSVGSKTQLRSVNIIVFRITW